MLRSLALLGLFACGGGKSDDCARAVRHLVDLSMLGGSADERAITDSIVAAVTDTCRKEGLSRDVADCILAAHAPAPDDQLRACPAFAANPPIWAHLRPPRDARAALQADLHDAAPAADGPREGPVHYTQIVGTNDSTCGLTAGGAVQCWGAPLAGNVPAGVLAQLAISEQRICGLDPAGHAHCASGSDPIMAVAPRVPADAFSAIAIGDRSGCGIRKRDGSVTCWSDTTDPPLHAPTGAFTQLAMTDFDACALRADHHVVCFGDKVPSAPTELFASLGTGWPYNGVTPDGAARTWPENRELGTKRVSSSCAKAGCCAIGADHALACTDSRLGAPPAGAFDLVAVFDTHACAVRTGSGGTVCWGDNDAGACNVPP